MPLPKCRYCSNRVKRKGSVVCFRADCNNRRLEENRQRYEDRVAKGERIKVRRRPPELLSSKPLTKEINCLGRCGGTFVTNLDKQGIPIEHFCPQCRRYIYEEERYADVWG